MNYVVMVVVAVVMAVVKVVMLQVLIHTEMDADYCAAPRRWYGGLAFTPA
jgi:hypothetical protein